MKRSGSVVAAAAALASAIRAGGARPGPQPRPASRKGSHHGVPRAGRPNEEDARILLTGRKGASYHSRMKLSVSVPDDLWTMAAGRDASPSEVVQLALRALAAQRHPVGPFPHAPSQDSLTKLRPRIDQAIATVRAARERLRELGYAAGVEFVVNEHGEISDRILFSLFREWGASNPEELVALLNDFEEAEDGSYQFDNGVKKRIVDLAWQHAELEVWANTLPEDFMTGFVGAVYDIWDQVENSKESSG